MAYWIYDAGNDTRPNYRFFYMDEDADLANLPTSSTEGKFSLIDATAHECCSIGSEAFSIATSKAFILNSNNEWREI